MSKPVCVISEHDFVASIADALQYVAVYHPPSFVRALAEDYTAEDCPAPRDAIAQILINSKMAAYGRRPICQGGRCQCVREDRDGRAHRQHASTRRTCQRRGGRAVPRATDRIRVAAGGARRAGTAARSSVSVFMRDQC
jgi:hypothetical protein